MSDAGLYCKAQHRRDDFALDIEVRLARGITVFFGPSGSGKSTTLAVISGLLHPDSGIVRLGTTDWLDTERGIDVAIHERRIAYLFQSLALFPHMTAEENVAFALPAGGSRVERRERARVLLEKLYVGKLAERMPRTFSGGEAQRVALARALAMKPRAILLDEPFSALDQALREELSRLVSETVDELDVPAVFVTHDRAEARALAHHVVRFERGRILREGPPDEALEGA